MSLGWKRCLKADRKDLTEGRRGMRSQAQRVGLAFERKRCFTPLDQRKEEGGCADPNVLIDLGREGKGAPFW